MDAPQKGDFSFANSEKFEELVKKGVNSEGNMMPVNKVTESPTIFQTDATIAGLIFKDGIILGAIVSDNKCESFHSVAPKIFCCGYGTSADIVSVTGYAHSELKLHSYYVGRESRVVTALNALKSALSSRQGQLDASLILGGVDVAGIHLYTISSCGSTEELPFAAVGSNCAAANLVFKFKYREGLSREEGIKLVFEAIAVGRNIDVCVITVGGNVEYLRDYQPQVPDEEVLDDTDGQKDEEI